MLSLVSAAAGHVIGAPQAASSACAAPFVPVAAPRVPVLVCSEQQDDNDDAMPSDIYSTMSIDEEPFPLDSFPLEEGEEELPVEASPPAPSATPAAEPSDERLQLSRRLLALAASCNRGESASAADKDLARELVRELEACNPTPQPTLDAARCHGTWELVFSDTQLFRSSPFFMAGRAVCADGDEARRYDWFCDMHRAALAISTIGKVRQIVSADGVTSEFEVCAGAVPFAAELPFAAALPFAPLRSYSGGLPLAVTGAIVSTASIESNLGDGWRLLVDGVRVRGSNVPGLRQALDAGLALPARQLGDALEAAALGAYANPRPLFKTTYLDGALRVSRDQDGKLFVYTRASERAEPTDYQDVPADLGLGKLWSGLTSQLLP